MFHLVSVWLTRFVVAAVLIALVVMYGPKWFAEQATTAAPPATLSSEKSAPVAPADKPAPAAAASEQTAPAADQAAGAASFARCQPIGRTARGELVYSMDCRRE
jgi:hypothetical protein